MVMKERMRHQPWLGQGCMLGQRQVQFIPDIVELLLLKFSHSLEHFYLGKMGLKCLLVSPRGGKAGDMFAV